MKHQKEHTLTKMIIFNEQNLIISIHIVRRLLAMQSWNSGSIPVIFLYNDTTFLPELYVKTQIWAEKDHCMQHIKLIIWKFWIIFSSHQRWNWYNKGSLITQICILKLFAEYLELNNDHVFLHHFWRNISIFCS